MNDYDENTTIRVIAPATLEEGFTFDVVVNDGPYTVCVPPGGVREGEEFEVPYNYNDNNRNKTDKLSTEEDDYYTIPMQCSSEENNEQHDELGAPFGRWRYSLCSCCDVITQSTCWMGFCCTPILMAQVMTRLQLSWKGQPSDMDETSLTFNRIAISMIIAFALGNIPLLGGLIVIIYWLAVVLFIGSKVRRHMRNKYKVPQIFPTKCGNDIEDCCCMFWCGCCSTIQLARHTHDDKEYPGYGCTTTGLAIDAPLVV